MNAANILRYFLKKLLKFQKEIGKICTNWFRRFWA